MTLKPRSLSRLPVRCKGFVTRAMEVVWRLYGEQNTVFIITTDDPDWAQAPTQTNRLHNTTHHKKKKEKKEHDKNCWTATVSNVGKRGCGTAGSVRAAPTRGHLAAPHAAAVQDGDRLPGIILSDLINGGARAVLPGIMVSNATAARNGLECPC
eukprot:2399163-Rhodomonas_salina.1